jgi:hypothetical protein
MKETDLIVHSKDLDSPDENASPNFEIETFEVFTFPLTEQQILDLEYEKQNKDARLGEIDTDQ